MNSWQLGQIRHEIMVGKEAGFLFQSYNEQYGLVDGELHDNRILHFGTIANYPG